MEDYKNEQLTPYKKIGGWLFLLCFGLIIGTPLRTLYVLLTSYKATSIYFIQFPGLQYMVYIDSFLSVIVVILSVRAGIALWSIKRGAVNIAKKYLYVFLGYSVIATILPFTAGLPSEANDAMIPEVAKGLFQALCFFGIWFWYLNVSKRVKATYENSSLAESKPVFLESEILDGNIK